LELPAEHRQFFENTDCPVCGAAESTEMMLTPDRFELAAGEQFTLVACQKCQFIYLNPRPASEAIGHYYESSQYQPFLSKQQKVSVWDRVYLLARTYMLQKKRHCIERLKAPGRLLDVGCGTGEFLKQMQDHGWQVAGFEKDESAASFGRDRYALDIKNGDLLDAAIDSHSFDVITLWHVLEHLYHPKATLAKMSNILKDDGILLIAVPNITSYDANVYGSDWVALDSPRHLWHFTPGTMALLCAGAGLFIARYRQMPLDAYFNCLMSARIRSSRRSASFTPVHLLYALWIASFSVLISSRLRKQQFRAGSVILYQIKKRG
jgi:SAM-dependent methyltransferase